MLQPDLEDFKNQEFLHTLLRCVNPYQIAALFEGKSDKEFYRFMHFLQRLRDHRPEDAKGAQDEINNVCAEIIQKANSERAERMKIPKAA